MNYLIIDNLLDFNDTRKRICLILVKCRIKVWLTDHYLCMQHFARVHVIQLHMETYTLNHNHCSKSPSHSNDHMKWPSDKQQTPRHTANPFAMCFESQVKRVHNTDKPNADHFEM